MRPLARSVTPCAASSASSANFAAWKPDLGTTYKINVRVLVTTTLLTRCASCLFESLGCGVMPVDGSSRRPASHHILKRVPQARGFKQHYENERSSINILE